MNPCNVITKKFPNRSRVLLITIVSLLTGVAVVEGKDHAANGNVSSQPNVVFIITDDQGYGDLSCTGNPILKTPAIDKLHAQSIRLTDYHVSPTCSPTRGALMSGHSANRAGTWSTTMGRSLLREGELTLGQVFQDSGYATGMFGKWHLGDNYPFRPQDRGFDEVVCHGGGGVGQTPDYWNNSYWDDTYFHNGEPKQYKGYCTDVFFKEAQRFIQDCQDSGKPFFTYISTNAPHSPFHCPEEYLKPFLEKGVEDRAAAFLGMIKNIDDNVGVLRDWLAKRGLEKNTLFIFTTDNGTAAGDGVFNAGMRGKKMSPYDGGHRVPFFWHWPEGGLKSGQDIDTLTMHVDILPTLIDLCGLKTPMDYEFEGRSIVSLIYNNPHPWPDRVLITDSQRVHYPIKWKACSIMTERWRLIDGEELYDIIADPGQEDDVAKSHPKVVNWLREEYEAWWDRTSPTFVEPARIRIGNRKENPSKLTSHDWLNKNRGIPWNQGYIRTAYPGPGYWAVTVEQAGWYEIELRRWPVEVDREIAKGLPAEKPVSSQKAFHENPGKALPITSATLSVGDVRKEVEVKPSDKSARFSIHLEPGDYDLECRFKLETDDPDYQTVGAFYVSVNRL